MKQGLLILILSMVVLNATAQDIHNNFNSYRKEVLSNYQEYRKGVLDNYARYLNGVWEEYKSFQGIKKDTTPKPTIIPKAEENNTPEPIKDPEVRPTIPEDKPVKEKLTSKPTRPLTPPKPLTPKRIPTKTFVFYDMSLKAPSISPISLNSVENSAISKVWDTYYKEQVKDVADNISQISRALGLNDWLQYELVSAYSESIYSASNDRTLLEHFLLSNLGYDVRLAKNGENLALLIYFDQIVYERNFVRINGTRYYIFERTKSSTKSYSTCQIPNDVYRGRPLELGFLKSNLNPLNSSCHNYQLTDGILTLSGSVNETAMKMIAHYPLCNIPNYAKSVVLPPFHEDILRQLNPQLKGMTQFEAVSALLHFMQHAFKYATDQQQHGIEKPYFIEENFYYPMNDCEDRAILFAFLVRNLVGLDIHLVQYPGHECTAINFNDDTITGDSYFYKGKRYIICDPTFIGARIGQCMPSYIRKQPKIEIW